MYSKIQRGHMKVVGKVVFQAITLNGFATWSSDTVTVLLHANFNEKMLI